MRDFLLKSKKTVYQCIMRGLYGAAAGRRQCIKQTLYIIHIHPVLFQFLFFHATHELSQERHQNNNNKKVLPSLFFPTQKEQTIFLFLQERELG